MPYYRLGAHTPMNFTLRPQDNQGPLDERGLSMSDAQFPAGRQQELNASDHFQYFDDPIPGNPNHVLVRPVGADNHQIENEMDAWAAGRANINPNTFPPPANPTIPALTTTLNQSWVQEIP